MLELMQSLMYTQEQLHNEIDEAFRKSLRILDDISFKKAFENIETLEKSLGEQND